MLPDGALVVRISDRKITRTVYRLVLSRLPHGADGPMVYLHHRFPKCKAECVATIWLPDGDVGLRHATKDEIKADEEKSALRRSER